MAKYLLIIVLMIGVSLASCNKQKTRGKNNDKEKRGRNKKPKGPGNSPGSGSTSSPIPSQNILPGRQDETANWVNEKPTATKITNTKANELLGRIKDSVLESHIRRFALLCETDASGSKKEVLDYMCEHVGYVDTANTPEFIEKMIDTYDFNDAGVQAVNYVLQSETMTPEKLNTPLSNAENLLKKTFNKALTEHDEEATKRYTKVAQAMVSKGAMLTPEEAFKLLRKAIDQGKPILIDLAMPFKPNKNEKYLGEYLLDIANKKANDPLFQGKSYNLVVQKLKSYQFPSKGLQSGDNLMQKEIDEDLEEEERSRIEKKRLKSEHPENTRAIEEAQQKEQQAKQVKEEATRRKKEAQEKRKQIEKVKRRKEEVKRKTQEELELQRLENEAMQNDQDSQKTPGYLIKNWIKEGHIEKIKEVAESNSTEINSYLMSKAMRKGLLYFDTLAKILHKNVPSDQFSKCLVDAYYPPFKKREIRQTFNVLQKSQYLKHLNEKGVSAYLAKTILAADLLTQEEFISIVDNFKGEKMIRLDPKDEEYAIIFFGHAYKHKDELQLHTYLMGLCENYRSFIDKEEKERQEELERERVREHKAQERKSKSQKLQRKRHKKIMSDMHKSQREIEAIAEQRRKNLEESNKEFERKRDMIKAERLRKKAEIAFENSEHAMEVFLFSELVREGELNKVEEWFNSEDKNKKGAIEEIFTKSIGDVAVLSNATKDLEMYKFLAPKFKKTFPKALNGVVGSFQRHNKKEGMEFLLNNGAFNNVGGLAYSQKIFEKVVRWCVGRDGELEKKKLSENTCQSILIKLERYFPEDGKYTSMLSALYRNKEKKGDLHGYLYNHWQVYKNYVDENNKN